MTDVRKLMGRLNPSVFRFDGGGRGGVPELTPQDIAAALGMIEDEMSREVFCAFWWPDGARLKEQDLLRMIGQRQRAEIERQWRRVQVARLELHIAKDEAASRQAMTDADKRAIAAIEARLKNAQDDCWPSEPTVYPLIRAAVIEEIRSPHQCTRCLGRAQQIVGERLVVCLQCDGTGRQAISDRRRAKAIGRDESTYRRAWARPYGWTYAMVSDAEGSAARAMRAFLSRSEAA